MANYFQLANQVMVALKLETATTFASLVDMIHLNVLQSLNTINSEVVNTESERWKFRERVATDTVVAGKADYDMPSGIIDIIRLSTVDKPLYYEYDWRTLVAATGTPNRYYITGDKVYLYPTPTVSGDGITIYYKIDKPAVSALSVPKDDMVLETDTTIIPIKFSNVLIFGAAWDVKGRPEQGRYQHFSTRYKNWLNIMKQECVLSAEDKSFINYKGDSSDDLVTEFFSNSKKWK
jgi:hypothetical protein